MTNFQVPSHAAAVTKSDSTEIFGIALYVGGAGDVVLLTEGGETVTWTSVPAGTTIVQRFTKVKNATTATNMVRQW